MEVALLVKIGGSSVPLFLLIFSHAQSATSFLVNAAHNGDEGSRIGSIVVLSLSRALCL